jgi:hypothetical protein
LPAQGSHRSVRGHIRPYGSSSNPFASPRHDAAATRHSLSGGVTVTPHESSKPLRCFSPTAWLLDASLPIPRVLAAKFPGFFGTIKALRLPAAHPAALRFLRLAVPWDHASFAPAVAACGNFGPGVGQPVSPPGLPSMETTGSPKFLGNPNSRLHMFFDPGRPSRPRPLRNACVAPATGTTKAPTMRQFRGSIAWLSGSPPTYHLSVVRLPAQDWLPGAGQALLGGLSPAGLR